MNDKIDSFKTFLIIFNNRVIQIDYNQSFPEFQNQTVGSLIELVLEKSAQPAEKKIITNYNLFCPCGNILEFSKLLRGKICEHKYIDNNIEKNLGDKYLLIEKQDENLLNKIKDNEKELSKNEFDKIFDEKKEKKKIKQINNKKGKKQKKKDNNNQYNKKPFIITEAFKKRIKQYIVKEERAQNLLSREFPLFYDTKHYTTLLSMGIDDKKAKAALRFTKNQLEEAVLYATNNDFDIEGREFLCYDNDEILDRNNLNENLKNEVKKEYPFLNEEQVNERITSIFDILGTKNNMRIENQRSNSFLGGFENDEEDIDEDCDIDSNEDDNDNEIHT